MRILVTGASRGIGAEIARLYAEAGHTVMGTARDTAGLIPLDVSDPDGFGALRTALEDEPLDLLVCNAAIYPDKSEELETGFPPEMWATGFATNVTGTFLTVQTALPALRRADRARIAIISSDMASQTKAPGGSYIYRATKAAVLNLGRNLATDLAGDGIAVGIYHPGWVLTDMGGSSAAITPEVSAQGLVQRFEELGPDTTGAFRSWDGDTLPY